MTTNDFLAEVKIWEDGIGLDREEAVRMAQIHLKCALPTELDKNGEFKPQFPNGKFDKRIWNDLYGEWGRR